MNRIDKTFDKGDGILNVYYTAGFPELEDTIRIAEVLEKAGVDIIELGLPFSDPLADGPTIQESSTVALANGMTLKVLFQQLETLREKVSVPVVLMGYINPILQYGFESFCKSCVDAGVDGLILPDLPMYEYHSHYKPILDEHGLYNIFLITPQTSEERIHEIDRETKGFIYMVSSASITGAKNIISDIQLAYFSRIRDMQLQSKRLIGFGISSRETFNTACDYASGAIIGSAFINQLKKDASREAITEFIRGIKS